MRKASWSALAVLAALGSGAAACGGGPPPAVAHLGSATTTTATGSGAGGGTGSSGLEAQFERYAVCMRAHGVSGWPDPTARPDGAFGFKVDGPSLGASPSQVAAAQRACQSILPAQSAGPPLTAAQQQALIDWAACIRAHGFPTVADPTFSGGLHFDLPSAAGTPSSGPTPQFQAAEQACHSKLPPGFSSP